MAALQPPLTTAVFARSDGYTYPRNTAKDNPVRICFGFKARDIPGEPCARPLTLANAFMEPNHERRFDWNKDHFYLPADIENIIDRPQRRLYMFLDINKHIKPSPIPLRCVKVTKKDLS
jgi:hypothetical protein